MDRKSLQLKSPADAARYPALTSEGLRESFLVSDLFQAGCVRLAHSTELDRLILGSAIPLDAALPLSPPEDLRCSAFCDRRELGVFNLGGAGCVGVDGVEFDLDQHDTLYVGRGSQDVRFMSRSTDAPARYYLVSFPAHGEHPTRLLRKAEANRLDLGADESANRRTIYQAIHPAGVKSCQLVMGWTQIAHGSVWNTMPPHTHLRRCEAYLYFNLASDQRVMHLMGRPSETRPLWVSDCQAVLSPPWSIHCGVGTSSYSFVWAMGGENQRFDDMDPIEIGDLR
ncbi:5-dehydro-4-deoxy-D-glucuronate isomerase [Botrimarina hoheduenensis]|uniref:5-dehydro-4-deoxy-D-glucuronate isomerase n=1 Tax=Botrimarina hoheduenensis TaxID=2528000 RepID=A0A5C5VRJ6_9BACT|nr:5-dehydro-4-deoxy-D-glucuronate isomerase [Botrimarina hoheduenensis]TWT40683.1 4-deoxy-L-threo-5-hexosulose-uronate ketol-isomerase [Botrimarina hoheduenensis]